MLRVRAQFGVVGILLLGLLPAASSSAGPFGAGASAGSTTHVLRSAPIHPQKLAITATAVPYIVFGSRVGITGEITPSLPGLYLVLQQKQGSDWVAVNGGKVRADGQFLLIGRPEQPESALYRVSTQKESKVATGVSKDVTVMVLRWQYLADLDAVDHSSAYLYSDGPVSVNGALYKHSVEVSGCRGDGGAWVDYNLGRRHERFAANVGLDDSLASGSTATFSVIVDGVEVSSGSLVLGAVTRIDVLIHDAFRIRLAVNTGSSYCSAPAVVFGDARILG